MTARVLVMAQYPPGRWNYLNPVPPFDLTTSVESWVVPLRADWFGATLPTPRELERYDVVLANLNPILLPSYCTLLRRRPPGQLWCGIVEGCGLEYLDPTRELLEVANACDLIANINQFTTEYLRRITSTRVEWVGFPYNDAPVRALSTPPEEQRREVLVCPRQQRMPSLVVAEALGLPVRAYFRKLSRSGRHLPLYWRHHYFHRDLQARLWAAATAPTPRIAGAECDLPTFWKETGGCCLWVNLDPRYTWARYVLDAAALGVPIITTRSTAHAERLFPDTTVRDVFAVDEAVAIGERLLSDEPFRLSVIEHAREDLSLYSADACVGRLSEALGRTLG